MNNIALEFKVVVDTDRSCWKYSTHAVQMLDPTKKGPGKITSGTLFEADKMVSTQVAIELLKSLLNGEINQDDFGASTIRILEPTNLAQAVNKITFLEGDLKNEKNEKYEK